MAGFDPEKITFFARTNARGQDVKFGIKAKDRQKHMYVIGKTGMGKSTLLENMAAQDILNGEGMAFLDPHGSAIEVLLEYIPEERLDDVVYFAPFDMENPIAFNIMEDVGADTRHLVVSGLMSTFKKIWEDAWSARMEYILTNALLALIEYPDTTLLSVNRMLADKAYRDKVVDYVKDPAVKAYWTDEFANYTERFAAEALPAIQNKIGQFTGNPLIRNIIGQPKSSFDVRKMMDEKKILLVNLSKGLVGETNADLLGSMLTTKIYLSAMSRAELPPAEMKQMPNFYFYVDEFQSFSNSTFANILSEARKYHLNLIIAHQYVEQMEETVKNAVFGNVGTTVAFRVGPFDAEVLEPIFQPQFMANDLVNLGFTNIYLTMMIDGVGSAPFSANTLPPVETPAKSHKFMAIKRSQQNYTRPRAEVEQIVTDLHTPEERVEAIESGEGGNKGGFTKPSGFFKVGTDKEFVKQKERIKQGLPRQKGPAQTPPGGGKSASESGASQGRKPDQPRAQKPAPAQKTPEDLRAILGQLAQSEQEKEATKKSKSTKDTSDFSGQKKPDNKPAVGDSAHKADLQAALAGILPTPEAADPAPAPKPAPRPQKPTKKSASKSRTEKQTKAKVSAPADKVTTPAQTIEPPTTPEPPVALQDPQVAQVVASLKSTFGTATDSDKPKVQPTAVVTAGKPKQKPATSEPKQSDQSVKQPGVVIDHTPQVTLETTSSSELSAEAAAEQLGSQRGVPAFTPTTIATEPDVKTVKQMLRHSNKERLPGMK